ncbi:MAG: hypothetical protein ABIP68_07560 [Ferruginibacter sp.]
MKFNQIYELSDNPRILLSCGSKNWNSLVGDKSQKSYLLTHPMWYFSFSSLPLYLKMKRMLKSKNIELIILNNSKEEHRFAKLCGFRSYFINQNLHVDEHTFRPINSDKIYDCVYTAQAAPFKRLHLAEKINSLYIITFCKGIHRNPDGSYNIGMYEPRIKHAKCNETRIPSTEVNVKLNQSKCGLALSAKEGSMLAFVEYLLAGIPVVTTKSKGGRDLYFNKDFVTNVKADSTEIKKAVDEIITKKINPEDIRSKTLKVMVSHRLKFYNLVNELRGESRKEESFESFSKKVWGASDSLEKLSVLDLQDDYAKVNK